MREAGGANEIDTFHVKAVEEITKGGEEEEDNNSEGEVII